MNQLTTTQPSIVERRPQLSTMMDISPVEFSSAPPIDRARGIDDDDRRMVNLLGIRFCQDDGIARLLAEIRRLCDEIEFRTRRRIPLPRRHKGVSWKPLTPSGVT